MIKHSSTNSTAKFWVYNLKQKTLSWSYQEGKHTTFLGLFKKVLREETIELLFMQKPMCSLNDVALMCPFFNGLIGPPNEILGDSSASLDNCCSFQIC